MRNKSGPKRTEAQRDSDRAKIADLYLRGTPLLTITDIINKKAIGYKITYQTVWNDLRYCRRQWQKESKRSIDLWVAEQLKKIDVLEMEYWEAWEKSKEDKTSSSIRSRGTRKAKRKSDENNGESNKKEEIFPIALEKWDKREQRIGDPRYLEGFYNCIMARLKILGREGPDAEDKAKEAAEKIRETIADIDSLMDLEPNGANSNGG